MTLPPDQGVVGASGTSLLPCIGSLRTAACGGEDGEPPHCFPCSQVKWGRRGGGGRGGEGERSVEQHRGLWGGGACVSLHVLVCWGQALILQMTYRAGRGSSSHVMSSREAAFPSSSQLHRLQPPGPSLSSPSLTSCSGSGSAGSWPALCNPRDSSYFSSPLPCSHCLPKPQSPLGFMLFLSSHLCFTQHCPGVLGRGAEHCSPTNRRTAQCEPCCEQPKWPQLKFREPAFTSKAEATSGSLGSPLPMVT